MSRRLLIRLAEDGAAAWLALGRDGRPLHGERPGLPPVDGDVAETVVLVPAEHVLVLPVPELPGSQRQRLQALPFAIEEQLAAPVEQQHVVLSAQPEAVLVVARRRMEQWLAQLADAGIGVDRMLPDGWLLPADRAVLLLHGERAIWRDGAAQLMAFPAAELDEHLSLLAATDNRPDAVDVIRVQSDALPADAPAPLPLARTASHADLLTALAGRLPAAGPLDLLTGPYAPRHRGAGAARSWRLAAVLATAAVLAALVFAFGERWALESRWQQQQAEMEALYRSVVPGTTPVADPVARLRSLIDTRATAGGDSGALALVAQVAPAIAGSGRYTIDSIEFRGGALELTLRAPDVASLDALRERLAALPPLQAELTAATPGSNGVEGRLRVRRAGPA